MESAGKREAAQFLRDLVEAVPYAIHRVLTDNREAIPRRDVSEADRGIQFTARKQDIWDMQHIRDRVCDEHGIEHRLTKVNHPWTNGQVERMNRTLKDATVKRHHYENHDELRTHLQLFLNAYNHARRLKALRGLTPCEFTCRAWTQEPKRFSLNPSHHTPRLNIERRRGKRIAAKGIYRDPVRSSHGHFVKASGLRWLSLMLLAPEL